MRSADFGGKTLTFDGIDERGADRPADAPRKAGMFSSSDRVAALLERGAGSSPIGEGDVKITDLECEVQNLRNTGAFFVDVEAVLISTVDTDSIGIELIYQAAKNEAVREAREEKDEALRTMKSLLCFREKREGPSEKGTTTVYNCVDLEVFEQGVVRRVFGNRFQANEHLRKHACALLVAGWTLCGCDFVELKGMRSDVVFQAVCDIVQRSPKALRGMQHVFSLGRDSDTQALLEARAEIVGVLRRLVTKAVDQLERLPRMARAANSARNFDDNDLAKAAWVTIYWSGYELVELNTWGFGERLALSKRGREAEACACGSNACRGCPPPPSKRLAVAVDDDDSDGGGCDNGREG
jgi:hypothetical protein